MNEGVLVTVRVITYNSERTILETLESIKAQTYQNIELIISDDCSSDTTVQICKDWLSENGKRFSRTLMLESPINTGVADNCNRSIKPALGEWIKGIAGDDLMLPNCIEDNVAFVTTHPEAKVVFSDLRRFRNDDTSKLFDPCFDKSFFDLDAEGQYQWLIQYNNPPALTLFYNRKFMEGFPNDERYPCMEDYPKWFHLTQSGVRLYYFDKVTALYRDGESLSHSRTYFYNCRFMDSAYDFFVNERKPLMKKYGYKEAYNDYSNRFVLYHWTIKLGINRINFMNRIIRRFLYALIYHK